MPGGFGLSIPPRSSQIRRHPNVARGLNRLFWVSDMVLGEAYGTAFLYVWNGLGSSLLSGALSAYQRGDVADEPHWLQRIPQDR